MIENAQALAGRLKERGADLVAGGTDTHLALVDLRPLGITGKDADEALERAGITCNKNGVPFDPLPPMKTSGIRVGSPAGTTRGFGEAEFRDIGDMVADVLGRRRQGRCGGRARRQRPRPRAVRPLPHLSGLSAMTTQRPGPTISAAPPRRSRASAATAWRIPHQAGTPGAALGAVALILPVITLPIGIIAAASPWRYQR